MAAFAKLRDLGVPSGLRGEEDVCSEGVGSGSFVTFHGDHQSCCCPGRLEGKVSPDIPPSPPPKEIL